MPRVPLPRVEATLRAVASTAANTNTAPPAIGIASTVVPSSLMFILFS